MKNKKMPRSFQETVRNSSFLVCCKKDKKIFTHNNDQGAIALDNYKKHLPNQFINAGISEPVCN